MVKPIWSTLLLVSFCFASVLAEEGVGLSSNEEKDGEKSQADVPQEEKNASVEPPDFIVPEVPATAYFVDSFLEKSGLGKSWIVSDAKKDGVGEEIAKYDGEWSIDTPYTVVLKNDYGLIMKSKARHHAISSKFIRPFSFQAKKPFVVQYEVKMQNSHDCGGAYIKLLTGKTVNLEKFTDKAEYSIMFGPDKCGMTSKLHFIVRFKNPKTNAVQEHHANQPSKSVDKYFSDQKSHLFKLVLDTDGSYKIFVDREEISSGDMLTSFEPPIVPPTEIDDADDRKPEDWDDNEKIVDSDAKKPDDWDENVPEEIEDLDAKKPDDWLDDEPEYVHDETKTKPDDWDEEMDGTWEPPLIKNKKCKEANGCGEWKVPRIKNPQYKGIWKAPMIKNPNYKGEWKPRKIPNPNHFEMTTSPFAHLFDIDAVGLELWTMTEGVIFDNFLVVDDSNVADKYAQDTWFVKKTIEISTDDKPSFIDDIIQQTKDNPMMWILWAMLILVPLIAIVICCCWNRSDVVEDDGMDKKSEVSGEDADTQECNDDEAKGGAGDTEGTDESNENIKGDQSPNESNFSKPDKQNASADISNLNDDDEGSFVENSQENGIRRRFKKEEK